MNADEVIAQDRAARRMCNQPDPGQFHDLVLQLRSLSDRSCKAAADIIEQLAADHDRLTNENQALRELAGYLIDACAKHRIGVPFHSSLQDLMAEIAADRGDSDGEPT